MMRATAAMAAAIVGMALAVGMFGAGMANAEDDKHWYFDVENQSNDTAIELRTQEDGEWSEKLAFQAPGARRHDQARLRDG